MIGSVQHLVAAALLFTCFAGLNAQRGEEITWSYGAGDDGPDNWSTVPGGELCDGTMQSPINILHDDALNRQYEPWAPMGFFQEPPLTFDGPFPRSVTNTGRIVKIYVEGYSISGAGLPGTFNIDCFEVHWGADSTRGSEHTVDGRQYAGELHMVYYSANYSDFEAASSNPKAVGTSAWFIEETAESNMGWEPVTNVLNEIQYAGSEYEFPEAFEPGFMVAADFNRFFRYHGSATYPGCQEGRIWSVFTDTVKMSSEQLDAFRSLSMSEEPQEEPLGDNFRPVQPLNDRDVYNGYIPTADNRSCLGRCGQRDIDISSPCQCNALCSGFNDCCEDYQDNCLVEICSLVHTYPGKVRKQRPNM